MKRNPENNYIVTIFKTVQNNLILHSNVDVDFCVNHNKNVLFFE